MSNWSGEIRQQVLQLLQERNRKEKGFTELFKHHERLFENWAAVRDENIRLMQQQGGFNRVDKGGGEDKDKILRLQEELTELHRNRGENASQVLSLSAKLTQKEAELSALQSQNAELVARIADLEEKEAQLNNNLHEHQATIALLSDEHSVLQLDFTSLEEKFRKVQIEYQELLQRYMQVKNQHAEVMNKENEAFMEKKRALVQKELEDAAAEKVVTPIEEPVPFGIEIPQIPTVCVVPKIAAHRFEAHENEVNAIRWSPNARHFATGGADRKVKIWEYTHTGIEQRGMLTGSNGAVLSIDFDTAGTLVLASSSDFACRVWSVDDRRLRISFTNRQFWAIFDILATCTNALLNQMQKNGVL
ncbi:unnamed protein product [Allacma fusca]|uniref:Autophagy-related protein 16 domain-containing protein n=1 Tax=Allacma fusca TaxID=39272 RepID=A0A8J2NN07_9HEXA|nr:unnamed protein product [Allacma fusca]